MIVLIDPLRLANENKTRGWHYQRKGRYVKGVREVVWGSLYGQTELPLPLTVTMTRIAYRAYDDDNLRQCFKPVRDQIATWLSVDDADPRITWLYDQRRGKPKQYAVEIKIEPRGDAT